MAKTLMYQETVSAPECVARQIRKNAGQMIELGAKLRQQQPAGGITIARGSSSYAASYFSYLCMAYTGLPVTPLPLSLTTLFNAPWHLAKHFALAISQSGQSTDIVESLQAARHGGAYTVSMINAPHSPLADAGMETVALHAGEEKSIAATKSYITSLTASAQLLAAWLRDSSLEGALQSLPEILEHACAINWQKAIDILVKEERMIVIGRGPGFACAQEAALKFKETCGIQAEAFSSAEVKHGPMALVDEGYPVLIFAPPGPEQKELVALADKFRSRHAKVLLAADTRVKSRDLEIIPATDTALSPVSVIQTFYIMIEEVARARDLHPDKPRYLNKVTVTV